MSVEETCPDCDAAVGEAHAPGCDVELCNVCDQQMLDHLEPCEGYDPLVSAWGGEWPGVAEARMRGWFARMTPDGWRPCEPDDEGAGPDLNRLAYFKAHSVDGLYEEREEDR